MKKRAEYTCRREVEVVCLCHERRQLHYVRPPDEDVGY